MANIDLQEVSRMDRVTRPTGVPEYAEGWQEADEVISSIIEANLDQTQPRDVAELHSRQFALNRLRQLAYQPNESFIPYVDEEGRVVQIPEDQLWIYGLQRALGEQDYGVIAFQIEQMGHRMQSMRDTDMDLGFIDQFVQATQNLAAGLRSADDTENS